MMREVCGSRHVENDPYEEWVCGLPPGHLSYESYHAALAVGGYCQWSERGAETERIGGGAPVIPAEMGNPADGHLFEVSFRLRGVYSLDDQNEDFREVEEWSPLLTQYVRAWSLTRAFIAAADLPLSAWYSEED